MKFKEQLVKEHFRCPECNRIVKVEDGKWTEHRTKKDRGYIISRRCIMSGRKHKQ